MEPSRSCLLPCLWLRGVSIISTKQLKPCLTASRHILQVLHSQISDIMPMRGAGVMVLTGTHASGSFAPISNER